MLKATDKQLRLIRDLKAELGYTLYTRPLTRSEATEEIDYLLKRKGERTKVEGRGRGSQNRTHLTKFRTGRKKNPPVAPVKVRKLTEEEATPSPPSTTSRTWKTNS